MSIDYVIEYDCEPKRRLKTAGILERLKEKQRADEVIRWFRAAGDQRPPAQMGFEFSHNTPQSSGEKQLIVVQDLLDHAADLDDLAHHCGGCPANRTGGAFGCVGFVNYPIPAQSESWLLGRLPVPDEPLTWLLLRQGIRNLGYDGASVKTLRDQDHKTDGRERAYFELPVAPRRRLGELLVDSDQVFEMIFGVGEQIIPNHAGILLLFFGAIDRDLETAEIQNISSFDSAIRERIEFKLDDEIADNSGIREIIAFFHAMYLAWKLHVNLYVDA